MRALSYFLEEAGRSMWRRRGTSLLAAGTLLCALAPDAVGDAGVAELGESFVGGVFSTEVDMGRLPGGQN